jgi:dCMP deaminase
MNKETVVVAFIPVIHRGYLDFLDKSGARRVCLVEPSDVPELEYLKREIRAIHFEEGRTILISLGFEVGRYVDMVNRLVESDVELCMPNEDVSHLIHKKHFQERKVIFVDTFLRWDWKKSIGFSPAIPDADRVIRNGMIETESVSRYMQKLFQEKAKSSDWWRQVAAMGICKGGQVVVAHNKHLPNEYVPYVDGDPRNNFGPGEYIEVSTALHAEAGVIAHAAKKGISLENADLYVTTFPCSGCANQISVSGFRRIFFTGGYSNLNGVKTLRDSGIELVYIES